jgi:hypothetical protein
MMMISHQLVQEIREKYQKSQADLEALSREMEGL